MEPMERVLAAARFEPVDCVPVAAAITDFYMRTVTPGLDGLTVPEQEVAMLARGAELFPGQPVFFMANPTPAIYPELINRIKQAAGGGPLTTRVFREVSVPMPGYDAVNLKRLEEIRYWIEHMPGELVRKYGYCDGLVRFENPFDTLVELVGSTDWFVKIATDPEFVHAAMTLFTEASIAGAKWLAGEIGMPKWVFLAEDFPGFVSRGDFEKFVVPYHKMLFDTFPDAVKLLHNDSRTTHLLGVLPECGMDVFHFGHEVDIKEAKEAMGGRVALMGNIDPVRMLVSAPPEKLRAECERIIEIGKRGGGFIFSTGGEVNPGTGPERVRLMLETASLKGKY